MQGSAPRVAKDPLGKKALLSTSACQAGWTAARVAAAARWFLPNLRALFVTGYAENAGVSNGHLDPGRG